MVAICGSLANPGLAAQVRADGRLLFAHSDLSGYSVFEEAAWWGDRAGGRRWAEIGDGLRPLNRPTRGKSGNFRSPGSTIAAKASTSREFHRFQKAATRQPRRSTIAAKASTSQPGGSITAKKQQCEFDPEPPPSLQKAQSRPEDRDRPRKPNHAPKLRHLSRGATGPCRTGSAPGSGKVAAGRLRWCRCPRRPPRPAAAPGPALDDGPQAGLQGLQGALGAAASPAGGGFRGGRRWRRSRSSRAGRRGP